MCSAEPLTVYLLTATLSLYAPLSFIETDATFFIIAEGHAFVTKSANGAEKLLTDVNISFFPESREKVTDVSPSVYPRMHPVIIPAA